MENSQQKKRTERGGRIRTRKKVISRELGHIRVTEERRGRMMKGRKKLVKKERRSSRGRKEEGERKKGREVKSSNRREGEMR
jgi:hypothetical protein